MAELTFNQVLSGITLALSKAFPSAQVFDRTTPQQVSPGDFNVIPVSIKKLEQLQRRQKLSATFDIIYYPMEDDATEDSLRIGTDLPLILETIATPDGDKIHCIRDLDINFVDGVLHCIAVYQFFVFAKRVTIDDNGNEISDTDLMRHLTLRIPTKEQ